MNHFQTYMQYLKPLLDPYKPIHPAIYAQAGTWYRKFYNPEVIKETLKLALPYVQKCTKQYRWAYLEQAVGSANKNWNANQHEKEHEQTKDSWRELVDGMREYFNNKPHDRPA